MRLKTVTDSSDGKVMIGPKQNNGNFDWFPVVEIKYLAEWTSDPMKKYLVSLKAVSPSLAGAHNIEQAESCCSVEAATEEEKAVVLAEYGIFAPVYEQAGNNLRNLLRDMREQLFVAEHLTGLVFDRQINPIGADGWHALAGEINPCAPTYNDRLAHLFE